MAAAEGKKGRVGGAGQGGLVWVPRSGGALLDCIRSS